MKTLVYGYGNPGRGDDALGLAVCRALGNGPGTVKTTENYQLNIEDAYDVAEYDRVIFVDASTRHQAPFEFGRLHPGKNITFTTHAMSPSSVLALCGEIGRPVPESYFLGIRGYQWALGSGMCARAKANMKKAADFLKQFLSTARSRTCQTEKKSLS